MKSSIGKQTSSSNNKDELKIGHFSSAINSPALSKKTSKSRSKRIQKSPIRNAININNQKSVKHKESHGTIETFSSKHVEPPNGSPNVAGGINQGTAPKGDSELVFTPGKQNQINLDHIFSSSHEVEYKMSQQRIMSPEVIVNDNQGSAWEPVKGVSINDGFLHSADGERDKKAFQQIQEQQLQEAIEEQKIQANLRKSTANQSFRAKYITGIAMIQTHRKSDLKSNSIKNSMMATPIVGKSSRQDESERIYQGTLSPIITPNMQTINVIGKITPSPFSPQTRDQPSTLKSKNRVKILTPVKINIGTNLNCEPYDQDNQNFSREVPSMVANLKKNKDIGDSKFFQVNPKEMELRQTFSYFNEKIHGYTPEGSYKPSMDDTQSKSRDLSKEKMGASHIDSRQTTHQKNQLQVSQQHFQEKWGYAAKTQRKKPIISNFKGQRHTMNHSTLLNDESSFNAIGINKQITNRQHINSTKKQAQDKQMQMTQASFDIRTPEVGQLPQNSTIMTGYNTSAEVSIGDDTVNIYKSSAINSRTENGSDDAHPNIHNAQERISDLQFGAMAKLGQMNRTQLGWKSTSLNPVSVENQKQTQSSRQVLNQTAKMAFKNNKNLQQNLMEQLKSMDNIPQSHNKIQIIDGRLDTQYEDEDMVNFDQSEGDLKSNCTKNLNKESYQNLNTILSHENAINHVSSNLNTSIQLNRQRAGTNTGGKSKKSIQEQYSKGKYLNETSQSKFFSGHRITNDTSQAQCFSARLTAPEIPMMCKTQLAGQIPWPKQLPNGPQIQTQRISQVPNQKYKVQYDIRYAEKRDMVELPHIYTPAPKISKEHLEKDFKHLPAEIKYTNDKNYTDIDKVRKRLRMNEIDHMNFDPALGTREGNIYFQDVYQKGEEGKQKFFYCSVDAKDVHKKDKLLKRTQQKLINYKEPNIIDQDCFELFGEGPEKVESVLDSTDSQYDPFHEDQELPESPKTGEQSNRTEVVELAPEEKDLEKDFFRYILNHSDILQRLRFKGYEKAVRKADYSIGDVQKSELTPEQKNREIEMKMLFQDVSLKTIYKSFESNNRIIETEQGGASKISLNQSAEIERKIKETGALNKFKPINYRGSLGQFINEVYDQMDHGYELDDEVIKKILCDQIIVKGESIFDKKVFQDIKKHILGNRVKKDNKEAPPKKLKIDPKKELFKFSSVEMDWIKDTAIKEERKRLQRIERLMQSQIATPQTESKKLKSSKNQEGNKTEKEMEKEEEQRQKELEQKQKEGELNINNTINKYKDIRRIEKDAAEEKRRIKNMTAKEFREHRKIEERLEKQAAKQRAKGIEEEPEIAPDVMKDFSAIVRNQQKEEYRIRHRTHKDYILTKIHYDEYGNKLKLVKDKNHRFLNNNELGNIAKTMDEFIQNKKREKKKKLAAQLALKRELESSNSATLSKMSQFGRPKGLGRDNQRIKNMLMGTIDDLTMIIEVGDKSSILSSSVAKTPSSNAQKKNFDLEVEKHQAQLPEQIKDPREDLTIPQSLEISPAKSKSVSSARFPLNNSEFRSFSPQKQRSELLKLNASQLNKIQYAQLVNRSPEQQNEAKNLNSPGRKTEGKNIGVPPQFSQERFLTQPDRKTPENLLLSAQRRSEGTGTYQEEQSKDKQSKLESLTSMIDGLQVEKVVLKSVQPTKAQILRQQDNERQMELRDNKKFIGDMLKAQNQSHDLNVFRQQTHHMSNISSARENMLKNSLTFDHHIKLHSSNEKLCPNWEKQAMKKAIAIQSLQKQLSSQQDLPMFKGEIPRINQQSSLDKKALKKSRKDRQKQLKLEKDLVLDQDIINQALTKKFQINKDFKIEQDLKYKIKVNKDELSTDITRNKKINEIKNVIRLDSDMKDLEQTMGSNILDLMMSKVLRPRDMKKLDELIAKKEADEEDIDFTPTKKQESPSASRGSRNRTPRNRTKSIEMQSDRDEPKTTFTLAFADLASKGAKDKLAAAGADTGTGGGATESKTPKSGSGNFAKEAAPEDEGDKRKKSHDDLAPTVRGHEGHHHHTHESSHEKHDTFGTFSDDSHLKHPLCCHEIDDEAEQDMVELGGYNAERTETISEKHAKSSSGSDWLIAGTGAAKTNAQAKAGAAVLAKHNQKKKPEVTFFTVESSSKISSRDEDISGDKESSWFQGDKVHLKIHDEERAKEISSKISNSITKRKKKSQTGKSNPTIYSTRLSRYQTISPDKSETQMSLRSKKNLYENVTSKLNTNLDGIAKIKEEQKSNREKNQKQLEENQMRSDKNKKKMHKIMRNLENEFVKRDWLDKTEQGRKTELNSIEFLEKRFVQGIIDFQKLDSICELTSILSENDIKEILPSYLQILKQNVRRDKFDYENFLSPKSIAEFTQNNIDNSYKMLQQWKGTTIWKHDKVVLNYKTFKEVIEQASQMKGTAVLPSEDD